jgi:hypothetical protein
MVNIIAWTDQMKTTASRLVVSGVQDSLDGYYLINKAEQY